MRNLFVLGALVAAGAAVSAPAVAQDAGPSISGNVALTTDYNWRNRTQSAQDLAIQGGFDFDSGMGFYAGAWASTIDFNTASDANVELDLYGGYAFEVAGVGLDVGAIYYTYPDAEESLDFFEVYGAVSKEFGAVGVGGSLNWDPDNETIYADVSASYTLMDSLSVSGGYGSYIDDGDGSFLTGWSGFNAGGTFSTMGVDLDLRYYQNDVDTGDFEDNIVLSISKAL